MSPTANESRLSFGANSENAVFCLDKSTRTDSYHAPAKRGRMSETWTSDRIIALAPDPSSAKAGRELANPRKWVTLGLNEAAIWGECQGSGSKPYRTQIDLIEPAFKCSCPSRKFPCKHALALFLLTDSQ